MDPENNDYISQDERVNALDQLTSYDVFMCSVSDTQGSTPHFPVVVIPSGDTRREEKWVGINALSQATKAVRQPEEGREALVGYTDCGGCLCYWYTDEMPCCMVFLIIMAVVLSILATPLTLLCLVPIIYGVNKARKKANEKDLPAARGICRRVCQWPCLCTIIWISVVTPFVVGGYAAGIVIAVIYAQ